MKSILKILFIFCAGISFGQPVFDAYEDNPEITAVVISEKMLQMLSKIETNDAQSNDFKDFVSGISQLKIYTTQSDAAAKKMETDLLTYSKSTSLTKHQLADNPEGTTIFYKATAKNLASELFILIEKNQYSKQAILMVAQGKIKLDKLHLLTNGQLGF